MNLLNNNHYQESKNYDEGILISDFRQVQYEHIRYFIELAVNYLSKLGGNYLNLDKITINKVVDYNSIYSNALSQIVVHATNVKKQPASSKVLFKVMLPTLIDKSFFLLNGNYYIPTLYIIDKPITIKKKSIKLSSLFNSISIYDKIVTFIGINIPAHYFLNLLLDYNDPQDVDLADRFCDHFQMKRTVIPEKDVLKYFADRFKCNEDKKEIIEYIETVFFDEYTKYLYQYCHDIPEDKITISNIVKMGLERKLNAKDKDFIDLRQKRIVFLEALLIPFFKRIATAAIQASRGYLVDEIRMDQLELVKFFHSKLHNKFIYDNVNAYSGMLIYKASMLNPGSENAPSIVADLHETHFRKLCPISISNQNPGETVFIVPNTKLDYFGQFVNT